MLLLKNNKTLPDIVFIDGGLGQLNQAIMVLNSIGIDSIQLVGVAKGESRKAGLETLITVEDEKVNRINLVPHDPALLLVNNIRDESHRFAIKNHHLPRLLPLRARAPLECPRLRDTPQGRSPSPTGRDRRRERLVPRLL